MPDAVVRLVPDSTRPYGFLAALMVLESAGESRGLTSLSPGKDLGRAVTDENGRFDLETRLPVLPLPMFANLVAEKAGWSDVSYPGGNLEVQPPLERNDLIGYLVPSLVLKGAVTDAATGFAIAGARIEASPSGHPGRDPGPLPEARGTTADLAGRFRLELGGAREADLRVSADGFLEGLVRVVRGSVPADLRIALARQEDLPSIEGSVTYVRGLPCPEARFSLDLLRPLDESSRDPRASSFPASLQSIWEVVRREDHRAGPDGAFRILLPCGGTWMVKARCGGFGGKKVVDVAARGATSCQVALDEDCRIRVRVVDGAGMPVVANVYLERGGTLSGSTTVAGAVEIGGVPIGEEIRIYAEREGRRSREVRAAPRPGGEVFDVGTLEIPPP
ncbi:MAG: carboxypeptidase-like regulatory domain-containing protein [Planctomycetes bacterium]|nr:carboxypeptidase-like regulatory domain-containing protein [Planctomycetota bacterium]